VRLLPGNRVTHCGPLSSGSVLTTTGVGSEAGVKRVWVVVIKRDLKFDVLRGIGGHRFGESVFVCQTDTGFAVSQRDSVSDIAIGAPLCATD
jgi:hypothetical protein